MNNRDMKKLPIFNYHITNQGGERLDVYIDGTIVDAETQELYREWYNDQTSVSFKSFRSDVLNSELKNIRITINSFGGQIGDAMAIHDFIKQLENDGYDIETIGMGMICSAATYILSSSKNSKISPNSWYMIHNVSGYALGDVNEVEKMAKSLRSFNDNIRDFYVNLTGKSKEQIEEWMNAETWFTGPQAVENGFVKSTTDQETELQPINKADWQFKNKNPLNVYNSFVNKPVKKEDKNLFTNIDMKNLAQLIGVAVSNAFANFTVTPKPAEGGENSNNDPVTNEDLSTVITNAISGINFEEHITNAVNEHFKNGLPENMVNQIKEAVTPAEQTPFNLKEDEGFKAFEKRVEEVENKILNGVGASQPPKNEDASKYEGVSFS